MCEEELRQVSCFESLLDKGRNRFNYSGLVQYLGPSTSELVEEVKTGQIKLNGFLLG